MGKIELTEEDIDYIIERIVGRLKSVESFPYCQRCDKRIDYSKKDYHGIDKIKKLMKKKVSEKNRNRK